MGLYESRNGFGQKWVQLSKQTSLSPDRFPQAQTASPGDRVAITLGSPCEKLVERDAEVVEQLVDVHTETLLPHGEDSGVGTAFCAREQVVERVAEVVEQLVDVRTETLLPHDEDSGVGTTFDAPV